jgi:hypothetical protein
MDDLVFSKEGLQKLDECLMGGARSISINEKSITFHNLDELIKLRNQVFRYLSGGSRIRKTVPIVTKGFYDESN